jgi:hypothetical protein
MTVKGEAPGAVVQQGSLLDLLSGCPAKPAFGKAAKAKPAMAKAKAKAPAAKAPAAKAPAAKAPAERKAAAPRRRPPAEPCAPPAAPAPAESASAMDWQPLGDEGARADEYAEFTWDEAEQQTSEHEESDLDFEPETLSSLEPSPDCDDADDGVPLSALFHRDPDPPGPRRRVYSGPRLRCEAEDDD